MTATTRDRILDAARDLLATRGVRRTTMEDVADRAGISRVTVYRYFGDRVRLIRSAALQTAEALEAVAADMGSEAAPDVEAYLGRIGEAVMQLPAGVMGAMAELQRVHPEVYTEVRDRERAAIRALFDLLYAAAEAQGRIRPGLDRRVVEVLFWEIVTGFLDNPELSRQGLTPSQVFDTTAAVLLRGILVDRLPR
jgi:AcrR family transcriptional regulator